MSLGSDRHSGNARSYPGNSFMIMQALLIKIEVFGGVIIKKRRIIEFMT